MDYLYVGAVFFQKHFTKIKDLSVDIVRSKLSGASQSISTWETSCLCITE